MSSLKQGEFRQEFRFIWILTCQSLGRIVLTGVPKTVYRRGIEWSDWESSVEKLREIKTYFTSVCARPPLFLGALDTYRFAGLPVKLTMSNMFLI